jgi:site-specific DNA recombinase
LLVAWTEDLDQQGSKLERPGLQAALEMVEAGAADGVIVAKLDRFARSLVDAVSAIERLTVAGGELVSVEDGFDSSTPMGRFARDMLIRLAELEPSARHSTSGNSESSSQGARALQGEPAAALRSRGRAMLSRRPGA